MPLRRATVKSQAAGLIGVPLWGQASSALATASRQRFLGEIEVAEAADQRREDQTVLSTEEVLKGLDRVQFPVRSTAAGPR